MDRVSRGICPNCSGELTDPKLSPAGYADCRSCMIAWRIEPAATGRYVTQKRLPGRRPPVSGAY